MPHLNARSDEAGLTVMAFKFFSGELNPHFFRYPSLLLYLFAGLFSLYVGARLVAGASADDLMVEVALDPSTYVLIARGTSATLGALTVIPGYLLGRNIGSCLLAVCQLHVSESQFGMTDVTMTFLIACAAVSIVEISRNEDARWSIVWAEDSRARRLRRSTQGSS